MLTAVSFSVNMDQGAEYIDFPVVGLTFSEHARMVICRDPSDSRGHTAEIVHIQGSSADIHFLLSILLQDSQTSIPDIGPNAV